jgi:ubiquinone/menaquinone biosynthesis C-methylase UbiE
MSAYEALAASYDGLTDDVDYAAIADFYLDLLDREGRRPATVLDMACGTGSLAMELAQRGLQVLGSDQSEEMLTVAYEKAMELETDPPFFICQSMQDLELPEPVDWIVSCLDAVNYITDPADCGEVFCRVYESLQPGGVFTFDVNSPEKLRGLDGQVFLDENEDTYCVWRAEFDETENICYYGMDLFQREGDLWDRSFEEHAEYAYTAAQLTAMLEAAGFRTIKIFGEWRPEPPQPGEQRLVIFASKE